MVLVDTNVLLRLVRPTLPEYPVLTAVLRRLQREKIALCYAAQNIGEFWNVMTRPATKNGYGLTVEQANQETRLIESHLIRLTDSDDIYQTWRYLLVQYQVSGRQVHDARLVAVMQVNGVSDILTFNASDFERYANLLTIIHPTEVIDHDLT